mmetsp:Transcript_41495/g.95377  ORF Transcript_41495/g.95377 Transcript_41495/m.95377 type:complete len:146 (-) Transcript_41495:247-684(-)
MGQLLPCQCQQGSTTEEANEKVETLAVSATAGAGGEGENADGPQDKLDEEVFREFEVEWRRPDGATILGLDAQYKGSKLRITGIHNNGLVEKLNAENPKHAVKVGDVLVSVNGVTDDLSSPSPASRMVGEFKRALVLQVRIQREP